MKFTYCALRTHLDVLKMAVDSRRPSNLVSFEGDRCESAARVAASFPNEGVAKCRVGVRPTQALAS